MPGFRASKERLTLLLGVKADGDFKLKPMPTYYSKNPRALENYAKFILPVLYKCKHKAWRQHVWLLNFFFFRPTPVAYGSSQARGRIRAAPAGLHHSPAMSDLSHICELCHSLWQCQILNPLGWARDWTSILMDTSWVLNQLNHNRNSGLLNILSPLLKLTA